MREDVSPIPASEQHRASDAEVGIESTWSNQAAPADDNAAPIPALPVSPVIRFCNSCGVPWDPSWQHCPQCAARGEARRTGVAAQDEYLRSRGHLRSALALYFALLSVSIVAMIVMLASEAEELSVGGLMVMDAAMTSITLAWCIAAARDVLPTLRTGAGAKWIVLAAALAVPTFLFATVAINGLQHLLDVPEVEYLAGFINEGYGMGWAVLLICVQPAVVEELAFRGVILSALKPVLGWGEAALVSALLFAILHLSIPSIPHLFVLGMLLAWLRQQTGSLYPSMLLHFAHNFLVLLSEHNRSLVPW